MQITNQLIIYHLILDAKINDALPFSLIFFVFFSLNQKEYVSNQNIYLQFPCSCTCN